jgi:hypothetical protein
MGFHPLVLAFRKMKWPAFPQNFYGGTEFGLSRFSAAVKEDGD